MSSIARNLSLLKDSITSRALRSSRDPRSIRLVLVTKNVDVDRIREAYDLGERDFGENRAQELLEKSEQLPSDIRWHFVGHLQTNKVKQVVDVAELIHSVDSVRLAEKIEEEAAKRNKSVKILIQCNTAEEKTKFGLLGGELDSFMQMCKEFRHLDFQGLMTIAPLSADENVIRKSFTDLRKIREALREKHSGYEWAHLSMGMSQDYEIAIDEGATIVRIGTRIFGERQ